MPNIQVLRVGKISSISRSPHGERGLKSLSRLIRSTRFVFSAASCAWYDEDREEGVLPQAWKFQP